MSELTQQLADVLGRPVLDRTGIAKPFDVNFVFTPDDTATGLMARWTNVQGHRETMAAASAAAAAGDERAAPSLLVALQEQLGLKLESTKGAVEVMVIDHVEKPAPN